MPKKGFSLIELIITLLILGILSTVIVTDLVSSVSTAKLEAAKFKLKSDIVYAQSLAVTRQQDYRVTFSPDPVNSYVINQSPNIDVPDPLTGATTFVVNYNTDPNVNGVIIRSTTLNSNFVEFDNFASPSDELGSLTSAATVNLSYKGSNVVVSITPRTGKVQ